MPPSRITPNPAAMYRCACDQALPVPIMVTPCETHKRRTKQPFYGVDRRTVLLSPQHVRDVPIMQMVTHLVTKTNAFIPDSWTVHVRAHTFPGYRSAAPSLPADSEHHQCLIARRHSRDSVEIGTPLMSLVTRASATCV